MTYDTTAMDSTMQEIENTDPAPRNKRNDLISDIANLEKEIVSAQRETESSDAETYGHAPISPEQANARHKNIVFLKKNLSTKKSEFEELGY